MISIIVSTYRRPTYLKKAIQSVLNQTYTDWELIVVSDGEDKEAREITESLKDKRIRYFEIVHFGNHSRVKNKGIMESKGEYIAFLDDDNQYRPDHLNILIKNMEKENVAMVYGDRWVIDEVTHAKPKMGVFSDFDPIKIFSANYIDTSDVLVKREALFAVGGFDEGFKKFLDWNLWIRMVKYGFTFKHIPLVITDYYLLPGSMSLLTLDSTDVLKPGWSPQDVEVVMPYLGTTLTDPKVAIYTLTYDRLKYTKASFASLYRTAGYPFDHFVVDNGSTDGTIKWLEKDWDNPLGKMNFRLNGSNHGISRASNEALEDIGKGYDIVMKVDNDAVFQTEGWLKRMVDLYKSNHRIVLSCYITGLKDNPGGAQRNGFGMLKGELIGMTRHLGGITHFVSADAYKEFRWPDDDMLHGFQDLYFSNYLLSQGYQMGYMENYYCSHGPMGTEGQYEDYKDYFERRKKEKTVAYDKKD